MNYMVSIIALGNVAFEVVIVPNGRIISNVLVEAGLQSPLEV